MWRILDDNDTTAGSVATGTIVVLALSIVTARWLSPMIYDYVIVSMTSKWYAAVLSRIPRGDKMLDVGVGTASALCAKGNADVVREKGLEIVGVDYEPKYVNFSRRVIEKAGLNGRVRTICASVYDADLPARAGAEDRPFDAVYFSGSISLMPDPAGALLATAKMLKPGGVIYITQTFQNRGFFLLEYVKPALKYLTTIDFGKLIFQKDILAIVARAGMLVKENRPIPGSVDNRWQTARLLVVEP